MNQFSYTDRFGDSISTEHYDDKSILVRVENDVTTIFVSLSKVQAEALYEALGEHLYGSLDEYDSEAISAHRAKQEALLADFKALIRYEEPTPKFEALANKPSPFVEIEDESLNDYARQAWLNRP